MMIAHPLSPPRVIPANPFLTPGHSRPVPEGSPRHTPAPTDPYQFAPPPAPGIWVTDPTLAERLPGIPGLFWAALGFFAAPVRPAMSYLAPQIVRALPFLSPAYVWAKSAATTALVSIFGPAALPVVLFTGLAAIGYTYYRKFCNEVERLKDLVRSAADSIKNYAVKTTRKVVELNSTFWASDFGKEIKGVVKAVFNVARSAVVGLLRVVHTVVTTLQMILDYILSLPGAVSDAFLSFRSSCQKMFHYFFGK